ncbi:DUF2125 domain-containing protein [Labrys neptuniae]
MPTDLITPAPRRSSRRIFLPTILFVLVAIAWSGFWWYASTRLESEWNRFIAKQAELGRQIKCGEQAVGGYPFRLEMHCGKATVDSTKAGRPFSAALAEVNAVAQVYQPNKVVLEAKGPVTLTDKADAGATLTADWQSAEASMAIWTSGPQNAAVVIKGLSGTVKRGDQSINLVEGGNVEVHIRLAEGTNAAPGAYDLAADVDAKAIAPLDDFLGSPAPVKASFRGLITKIDLRPMPMPERLRDWAAAGGTLEIAQAQIDRGPSSVRATGAVGLETSGFPSGDLTVALSGVPELAQTLKQSGRVPDMVATTLTVGLPVLGKPTNIDGKAAVEVPLTIADGKLRAGAFLPGLKVPRLFAPE